MLSRSPDLIASILAVNMLGISYVPLDVTMPEDRIHYIIQDSDISVLITDDLIRNTSMGKRQFKSKSFAKQKNLTLNPKVANSI